MKEKSSSKVLWVLADAAALLGPMAGLVLLVAWVDRLLRRRIWRRITNLCVGSIITRHGNGDIVASIIPEANWWKCVLPWPGKKSWANIIITKATLLGAEFEYCAVSAWDWDEAWTVKIDHENIIAASNKTACALAFLKHCGVVRDALPTH